MKKASGPRQSPLARVDIEWIADGRHNDDGNYGE